MKEELIKSPCISVCLLNQDDICEGCYRSAREITDWTILSNPQKHEVMNGVHKRAKRMNKYRLL